MFVCSAVKYRTQPSMEKQDVLLKEYFDIYGVFNVDLYVNNSLICNFIGCKIQFFVGYYTVSIEDSSGTCCTMYWWESDHYNLFVEVGGTTYCHNEIIDLGIGDMKSR